MAGLITAVALAAASFSTAVHSMSIGHSRLLSPVGKPLRIQTPLLGVSPQDSQSLSVSVAPASAWQQAGLVPPVDLSSLQVAVFDGVRPGSRLVTVSSGQPLLSAVADLLLVVRSSSGQVQHQVSVLAPADIQVAAAATAQADRVLGQTVSGSASAPGRTGQSIQVKRGDTLFSLARRHAVPGVSLHQWMVAVQAANPSAFIQDNVNLLKAGATLVVPDQAALVALSDAQARRVYQQHGQAFAGYRQRMAARTTVPLESGDTGRGTVSAPVDASVGQPQTSGTDKVVLSTASSLNGTADDALALQKNTQDAESRVVALESNVKNLSNALQQQGIAASEVAAEGMQALADVVDQAIDTASNSAEGASGSGTAATHTGGATGMPVSGPQGAAGSGASGALSGETSASSTAAASSGSSTSTGTAPASSSATASGSENSATSAAGTDAALPALSLPSSGLVSPGTSTGVSSSSLPGPASAVPGQSSKSFSFVSWFQDNLWAVLAGIFALVVVIVVWLLRRAGGQPEAGSGITEDMVRERLQGINLDLDEPAQGGSNTNTPR